MTIENGFMWTDVQRGGRDMGYKVLLVEDDHDIREAVADYFTGVEGSEMEVSCACDGEMAEEMIYENRFDLILLDIMLPGVDGWTLCRQIRRSSDVPVIFITAKAGQEDVLYGYTLGCDDYVIKPFAIAELYAKSIALMGRAKGTVIRNEMMCGDISCDPLKLSAAVCGVPVELPRKEMEMLIYLMENRNRVVSRVELLINVWGYEYDGRVRVVDDHIRKLRKALGPAAKQIRTVITKGYQIKEG